MSTTLRCQSLCHLSLVDHGMFPGPRFLRGNSARHHFVCIDWRHLGARARLGQPCSFKNPSTIRNLLETMDARELYLLHADRGHWTVPEMQKRNNSACPPPTFHSATV